MTAETMHDFHTLATAWDDTATDFRRMARAARDAGNVQQTAEYLLMAQTREINARQLRGTLKGQPQ